VAGQPEHGEAGQVDPGGEQGEVGGDQNLAADPGPPPAVPPGRARCGCSCAGTAFRWLGARQSG